MIEAAEHKDFPEPTTPRARPFLKWAGGKSSLASAIRIRMPFRASRHIEPFLGGGAVLFELDPMPALVVDTNPELVNAFLAVQRDVETLIRELSRYVYDRELFYRVRQQDQELGFQESDPTKRAARMIFLNKTCFNGLYRVNSKGHFNVPFGRYDNPLICDAENLRACHRRLQNVELIQGTFLAIEEHVRAGDVVYFDPPYVPLSATASFHQYTPGGFSPEDHRSLRDLCRRLDERKVPFLVSNSDTVFVRDLYDGFRIEQVHAPRAINSKGGRRGAVAELIIRNF
jgi:DNA adenine methylase